jgi:hypothetical protein
MRAEQVIAGAAGLDAARACEPGPDHAADRAGFGSAEQRRGVHGIEGELLVLGVDQRFDIGERRTGLHRDDQLVRFIGGNRVERREIEHRIGRHRLADPAFRAVSDDLERLIVGDRRAHHLLDVPGVTYS